MRIINGVIFLILLVWISLECKTPSSSAEELEQLAKTVTVRVFSANKTDTLGGSGVMIAHQGEEYLIITNDHVVSNRHLSYKIQTFDQKTSRKPLALDMGIRRQRL